ncbi:MULTISPECIES: hypothetical protein [unclassified Streptomyces]|nr:MULTISPECIES: hypothetical protein [unclassified Streptomyces]
MGAFADSADRDGRYHIRYDVPALTHLFQGSDLEQWERRLREKPRDEPLSPKNPMAEWAKRNRVFLDSAMPLRPWDKDPTPTTPTPQPPPTPEPTPGPSPTPR